MIRIISTVAIVGLFSSFSAEAKITTYTNQQVLEHLLKSAELAKVVGTDLTGTDLYHVDINLTAPASGTAKSIGTVYNFELQYSTDPSLPSVPTVCQVKAAVVNEKTPSPAGLVANHLSKPKIDKPDCAM